jgi:hypothetical protein
MMWLSGLRPLAGTVRQSPGGMTTRNAGIVGVVRGRSAQMDDSTQETCAESLTTYRGILINW